MFRFDPEKGTLNGEWATDYAPKSFGTPPNSPECP